MIREGGKQGRLLEKGLLLQLLSHSTSSPAHRNDTEDAHSERGAEMEQWERKTQGVYLLLRLDHPGSSGLSQLRSQY
ncbi:potassium voltage-gated channel subfamily E member 3 isoform X3 [Piliocolobus tephrosceles]|uniref:potassium voltage-gated channel subfamily E member 3 isoform X3 n=1 Tax=Piliocolobus tephrosceles TaxID=591936 RepID=UPI000C2A479C|nr:potassium voltage-gated channel subfamily E member 3 isoform X3 [Piliocolobus tephrosceles]